MIDPVFQACDLRPDDYAPLLTRLKSITTAAIAAIVARPWLDWQFAENERIDVAVYLDNRRPKLIEALEQL